jgi:hypothetical protein
MKTTNCLVLSLVLALGATAAGCSAAEPSTPPGDDTGSGAGDGGSGDGSGMTMEPVKPLDATGRYAVHSTFDLASNMPGTAGTVVNTIIAATDGADDPTAWIVDQLIAQLPNGPVKSALDTGKLFVVGYLNDRLLDFAPDFVSTMVLVGHDFGDIAKGFGLNETLQLTRAGDGYTAVHTVTGVHFKLDNQELDFALTNYHLANIVVNNVAVAMDATGQLTIASHDVPLAYGQILRMGLDAAIIPLIDPSAQNLGQLLANKIDCARVGAAVASGIADFLGFNIGSAGTFTSACSAGLTAGSKYIYLKIDAIDGTALQFGLAGTARGTDKNKDRMIDTIQTGAWAGTLSYGGTPTPLAPATFFGERM